MIAETSAAADLEPHLAILARDIGKQANQLEERARDLEDRAADDSTTPPREEINRLWDQVAGLRYRCQVLDEAARICGERGTAAETAGIGFVLPPGYIAVREHPATPDEDGAAQLLRTRRELGLSVRAMGDALGVPFNTIGRWERREMAIQQPSILRLALERLMIGTAQA